MQNIFQQVNMCFFHLQVDEMDEDKDSLLTVSELAKWIERKQTDQVTI